MYIKLDGKKLTEAVEASRYSVATIAKIIGFKPARIYQLMWNGGNTNDFAAKRLAKLLGVPLSEIRGEE